MKRLSMLACLTCALVVLPADAHTIIRRAGTTVPMSTSVIVPAGVDLVFISSVLPDAADPSALSGSTNRFGNTATQAKSVLRKISKELEAYGLTLADVIRLNVYLVGDPDKNGEVDYQGLMSAYLGLYGMRSLEKSQPVRTTLQVAGLPIPGVLVTIEAIAARHPEE